MTFSDSKVVHSYKKATMPSEKWLNYAVFTLKVVEKLCFSTCPPQNIVDLKTKKIFTKYPRYAIFNEMCNTPIIYYMCVFIIYVTL